MNTAQYRVESFRVANPTERRWLAAETFAALVAVTFALASRSIVGAAWVVTNVVMRLTAAAWASHLPHRPPLFLAIARALEWTHSGVIELPSPREAPPLSLNPLRRALTGRVGA